MICLDIALPSLSTCYLSSSTRCPIYKTSLPHGGRCSSLPPQLNCVKKPRNSTRFFNVSILSTRESTCGLSYACHHPSAQGYDSSARSSSAACSRVLKAPLQRRLKISCKYTGAPVETPGSGASRPRYQQDSTSVRQLNASVPYIRGCSADIARLSRVFEATRIDAPVTPSLPRDTGYSPWNPRVALEILDRDVRIADMYVGQGDGRINPAIQSKFPSYSSEVGNYYWGMSPLNSIEPRYPGRLNILPRRMGLNQQLTGADDVIDDVWSATYVDEDDGWRLSCGAMRIASADLDEKEEQPPPGLIQNLPEIFHLFKTRIPNHGRPNMALKEYEV